MNNRLAFALLFISLSFLHCAPASASHHPLAGDILTEINLARARPLAYAAYLRQVRDSFQGRICQIAGSPTAMQTREGVAAVDEAIRFLDSRMPLPPLAWSPGLAAAAAELAREQAQSGAEGHGGGRSGDLRERVERRGIWEGGIAENIAYGPGAPRGMVMQLIIDDGVPERGHRATLFSPSLGAVGIACAPHPRWGGMCVMDFAGSFRE